MSNEQAFYVTAWNNGHEFIADAEPFDTREEAIEWVHSELIAPAPGRKLPWKKSGDPSSPEDLSLDWNTMGRDRWRDIAILHQDVGAVNINGRRTMITIAQDRYQETFFSGEPEVRVPRWPGQPTPPKETRRHAGNRAPAWCEWRFLAFRGPQKHPIYARGWSAESLLDRLKLSLPFTSRSEWSIVDAGSTGASLDRLLAGQDFTKLDMPELLRLAPGAKVIQHGAIERW